MGILASLLGQAPDRSPSSDWWYQPIGAISKAGVQVGEDQALKISAVLQGVRFICQTIAGLPKGVFRRSEDGRSRTKVPDHPLNRILRRQPNQWQTAFQFIENRTAHAILSGVGLAERVYTGDELTALVPLNPKNIAKIDQMSNGMLVYVLRRPDGSTRRLRQDEAFSLCGFGVNDVRGLPLIEQMRETAGLELATEGYGAAFFSNSAMPRVVLSSPKQVGQDIRRRMKDDWNMAYGGDRQHGTALLEEDTKIQVLSTKNDEAQFIESRKFLIAEFSRFLDVTPHHLSDMEKSSYNNMEQMSLETVVYSLTPWVERWEQSCSRDLLTEDEKHAGYYVKFDLRGLLRGDTTARQGYYQSGINTGWLTRNEVRELEDFNPIEGLDEPLQPQNMAPVGAAPVGRARAGADEEPEETEETQSRARAIANAAAERCVRRELAAAWKWSERKSGNDASRKTQVEAFYRDHAEFMTRALAMAPNRASGWCAARCAELLNGGHALSAEAAICALTMEAMK